MAYKFLKTVETIHHFLTTINNFITTHQFVQTSNVHVDFKYFSQKQILFGQNQTLAPDITQNPWMTLKQDTTAK